MREQAGLRRCSRCLTPTAVVDRAHLSALRALWKYMPYAKKGPSTLYTTLRPLMFRSGPGGLNVRIRGRGRLQWRQFGLTVEAVHRQLLRLRVVQAERHQVGAFGDRQMAHREHGLR